MNAAGPCSEPGIEICSMSMSICGCDHVTAKGKDCTSRAYYLPKCWKGTLLRLGALSRLTCQDVGNQPIKDLHT